MRIAFIDHSFHKKTLSSNFFVNILERNGLHVDRFWDDSWRGGKPVIFEHIMADYDAFVFWQQAPKSSMPFYKTNSNIVYIPMLDNYGTEKELHWNRTHYREFAGTKVLSFSKALHNAFLSHGIPTKYAAYYPHPSEFEASGDIDTLGAFFWQRRPDQINWDTIKRRINKGDFDFIHLHMTGDPGIKSVKPTDKDLLDYNIRLSDWFKAKEEYYELVNKSQVYFAPRKSEGIGIALLEAMAMGKCVVAPNFGTMNEYIMHGINGLLYEIEDETTLHFDRDLVRRIGLNARKSIEIGYESWIAREHEIIDFIITSPKETYRKYYSANTNVLKLAAEIAAANGAKKGPKSVLSGLKRDLGQKLTFARRESNFDHVAREVKSNSNSMEVDGEPQLDMVCGKYMTVPYREGLLAEGGKRLSGEHQISLPGHPLVTIITVVYNCAAKIQRAMDSVLNQSYHNIEYVVVDGGSTDGTLEIIQSYESRIDYYVSQHDNGIYDAMNKGLSLSHGDYIGIVNADDMLLEDSVADTVKEILSSGADYSAGEDYCVDENGNFVGIFPVMYLDERALVAQHPCNHGAMLIGKDVYNYVGYYDLKYKIGADYKLQLKIVTNEKFKGCKINKAVHYFEMAGTSGQQRTQALQDVQDILIEFLPGADPVQVYDLVYFMHERIWNDDVCNSLERLVRSGVFTRAQIVFLVERMVQHGYVQAGNEAVNGNRRHPRLTFKKAVKYILPYGFVGIYKKWRHP